MLCMRLVTSVQGNVWQLSREVHNYPWFPSHLTHRGWMGPSVNYAIICTNNGLAPIGRKYLSKCLHNVILSSKKISHAKWSYFCHDPNILSNWHGKYPGWLMANIFISVCDVMNSQVQTYILCNQYTALAALNKDKTFSFPAHNIKLTHIYMELI